MQVGMWLSSHLPILNDAWLDWLKFISSYARNFEKNPKFYKQYVQSLNIKNMDMKLRQLLVDTKNLWKSSFFRPNKSQYPGSKKKRYDQVPLLKLQLSPYNCVGCWLLFLGDINTHFHVEWGSKFLSSCGFRWLHKHMEVRPNPQPVWISSVTF